MSAPLPPNSPYEERAWESIKSPFVWRASAFSTWRDDHRTAMRSIFEALDARETWTAEDVKALLRRWL